jgi:signal peptidase I
MSENLGNNTPNGVNIGASDQAPKTGGQSFLELVRFAIIALVIVVPIRLFVAQPFIVSGSSMVPTFENSEYLIVDELSYHLSGPHRDDVVVFKYPLDQKKFFIKRIIGLPNETVKITNGIVTIINNKYPDGFILDEPYIKDKFGSDQNTTLGENEYFVMGDNRNASSDSRVWGPVHRKFLVGRALLRLFPINKISFLPGHYSHKE